MMAAWGETLEEKEGSQQEEAAVALMARSESESDFDPVESLSQLKDKVQGIGKAKIEELLLTSMDECDAINAENCMLKDVCSELKKDVRMLKRNKQELEHVNEVLKCEKLKVDEKTLTLGKDLDTLKESMNQSYKSRTGYCTVFSLQPDVLDLRIGIPGSFRFEF